MKILILVSAILVLTQARSLAAQSNPEKFTVCSIIPTPDMDDAYKELQKVVQASPQNFNPIIELTSLSSSNSSEWLNAACKSGIKCDLLFISRDFVEERKIKNALDTLAKKGCEKSCDGILSDPMEVYFPSLSSRSTTSYSYDYSYRNYPAKQSHADLVKAFIDSGSSKPQAEIAAIAILKTRKDSNLLSLEQAFGGNSGKIMNYNAYAQWELTNYFRSNDLAERLGKHRTSRANNDQQNLVKLLGDALANEDLSSCEIQRFSDAAEADICSSFDDGETKEKLFEAFSKGNNKIKDELVGSLAMLYPNDPRTQIFLSQVILNPPSELARNEALHFFNLTPDSDKRIISAYFDALSSASYGSNIPKKLSANLSETKVMEEFFNRLKKANSREFSDLLDVFGNGISKLSPEIEELLNSGLTSTNDNVKAASARILMHYRKDDLNLFHKILPMLDDKSELVRTYVASALDTSTFMKTPDIQAEVIDKYKDFNKDAQRLITNLFYRQKLLKPTKKKFILNLSSPSSADKELALDILGMRPEDREDPKVISAMLPLLKDSEAFFRRRVVGILGMTSPLSKEVKTAIDSLKNDPDKCVRAEVSNVLYGGERCSSGNGWGIGLGN